MYLHFNLYHRTAVCCDTSVKTPQLSCNTPPHTHTHSCTHIATALFYAQGDRVTSVKNIVSLIIVSHCTVLIQIVLSFACNFIYGPTVVNLLYVTLKNAAATKAMSGDVFMRWKISKTKRKEVVCARVCLHASVICNEWQLLVLLVHCLPPSYQPLAAGVKHDQVSKV